uniref:DNA 3'-5' helicase n=1 Tax=Moniliophthora roreri TaxID=221103 RepID=A0A0W0EYT3_MONRR
MSTTSSSSPSGASNTSNKQFTSSSPDGLSLCSRIIQKYAPYVPHDYILDGVAAVLDGKDLIAITPTGSGKTGYMAFFLLIVKELVEHPTKYPEIPDVVRKQFPEHPLMLVICPTDYMEYQLEENFSKLSLKSLIINMTTTCAAYEAALPDLWKCSQDDLAVSAVLMSPEQLTSSEFGQALENKNFQHWIFALSVDEVHLLLSWGKKFCKLFQQIGLAQSRLPDSVVVQGLTATMQAFFSLEFFFTNQEIKIILDHFASITKPDDIHHLMKDNPRFTGNKEALWECLHELEKEFSWIKADKKKKKAEEAEEEKEKRQRGTVIDNIF